jgi:hypothetical protein
MDIGKLYSECQSENNRVAQINIDEIDKIQAQAQAQAQAHADQNKKKINEYIIHWVIITLSGATIYFVLTYMYQLVDHLASALFLHLSTSSGILHFFTESAICSGILSPLLLIVFPLPSLINDQTNPHFFLPKKFRSQPSYKQATIFSIYISSGCIVVYLITRGHITGSAVALCFNLYLMLLPAIAIYRIMNDVLIDKVSRMVERNNRTDFTFCCNQRNEITYGLLSIQRKLQLYGK